MSGVDLFTTSFNSSLESIKFSIWYTNTGYTQTSKAAQSNATEANTQTDDVKSFTLKKKGWPYIDLVPDGKIKIMALRQTPNHSSGAFRCFLRCAPLSASSIILKVTIQRADFRSLIELSAISNFCIWSQNYKQNRSQLINKT